MSENKDVLSSPICTKEAVNDLLDSDERFKVQEAVRLLLYSLAGVKLDAETINQTDKLFKMIRDKKK